MKKLPRKSSRGGDGQTLGCATSVNVRCAEHAACLVLLERVRDLPRAEAVSAPRGPVALQWAGEGPTAGVSTLASGAFSFTKCCLLIPQLGSLGSGVKIDCVCV